MVVRTTFINRSSKTGASEQTTGRAIRAARAYTGARPFIRWPQPPSLPASSYRSLQQAWSSADDDAAGHSRVKRTEVGIRTRDIEALDELFLPIEHRGLELVIGTDDVVRHVIAIRPPDSRARGHLQIRRRADDVVDGHVVVLRGLCL